MKRHFTAYPSVEGYADRQSYAPGDTVDVHCSGRAASVTVTVTRVGAERTEVWRSAGLRISEQPVPDDAYANGARWPVSFNIPTDPSWRSGFYEVGFHAEGESGAQAHSEAFFVLRPAAGRAADAVMVLATNTYNAYNQWGGRCLYTDARQVSFDRPLERGYVL